MMTISIQFMEGEGFGSGYSHCGMVTGQGLCHPTQLPSPTSKDLATGYILSLFGAILSNDRTPQQTSTRI